MRRNVDLSSTLFALASGSLPSAVAIVKLSGPDTFSISSKIFRPRVERARGIWKGSWFTSEGVFIDEGIVLSFVAPHSHTGEDTIEFHCHGAVAIVRQLQEELLKLGARPAEKGEFSYRAIQHGKVSPGELETLGDLFLARSPEDLSAIYGRRDAGLEKEIEKIRANLIRALAIYDTAVDFSDEYSQVVPRAVEPIQLAIQECSVITQRYDRLKEPQKPPRIALVGRPNAGKSSLFNRVLGRYRAIVHVDPGTTRDVLEETVLLNGRAWTLTDTAGVRAEVQGPEALGIELGTRYLEGAAFWILVVDGTVGLGEVEAELLERHGAKPHLILWNKRDLPEWNLPQATLGAQAFSSVLPEDLDALLSRPEFSKGAVEQGPLPTAVAVAKLNQVRETLSGLLASMAKETPPEYLSEELRGGLRDLESVIGEVGVEDVLDRVFGEFCIGK